MNEEIDESDFYHQDFTTASEWEIFIARLEEIIHEWKVESNKGVSDKHRENDWIIYTEKLPFADVDFTLTLYRNTKHVLENPTDDDDVKAKNPIDTDYDFSLSDKTNVHPDSCLAQWYGLDEFIVLAPTNNSSIVTESRIKILLSSLHIVAGNINCEIPMFVQIREKWQRCYLGVYEGNGVRTSFEMVHLRRGPQHCQFLTGLVDLFKTKVMSPVSLDAIVVSVQLTYTLSDFGSYTWRQDGEVDVNNFDSNAITILPLGVTVDPVETLLLKATWSQIPDNLIVDSENYSNFDPLQAPRWSTLVDFADQQICLLSDSITEFLQMLNNNLTIYDILGDFANVPTAETSNPLDLLTEPKVPTISSVIIRAARNSLTKTRKGTAPLSDEVLVPILYFMFPDAEEKSVHQYYDPGKSKEKESEADELHKQLEDKFKGFKTCRFDSLIWRLTTVLTHALQTLGGSRALAHLWYEFVQEMRYRWEKSIIIPGLIPGFPDARTCLLHQKLQMLNCCIERKKAREAGIHKGSTDAEDSSDEEEFFDCSPDKSEEEKNREKHSLWNQPVGRERKLENLKLLRTGDQLYIPITQESGPKTEDQLQEDTDLLLKLGSDATGSELRARMMSASLLSDMESFKAANPGSILEDFIRWYSPRDWIEEDELDEWGQRKGHLSSRMLISDNTWVDMWKSAKPVPANRQKRLFDDTREAEKVLHFLDSSSVAQVAELLLPVLVHASIYRVAEEYSQINVPLEESLDHLGALIKTAERITREMKVPVRRYELFVQEITKLELTLSQANSLMYKFNPSGITDDHLGGLVAQLIRGREVELDKQSIRDRLVDMFTESQKAASLLLAEQHGGEVKIAPGAAFPQASEREFVMRVAAHRPAAYSTKSPQMLRAILSRNEFRLAGAFSEDIVFF